MDNEHNNEKYETQEVVNKGAENNNHQGSLKNWIVYICVTAIVLGVISVLNTCDAKRIVNDINNNINNNLEKDERRDSVAISAVMGVRDAVNENTDAMREAVALLDTIASKMDSCLDCGQTQHNKNKSQNLKRKKKPSSHKPETAPVVPTPKPQPDTIKVPKDTVVSQNPRPEVGGCTVSVTSRNIGGDVNAAIAELRRRQSYER